MIGIGNLFQAGAGGTTTVCTPAALTVTSPASLHLNLDDIQILQLSDIDATPYGALPSNTNEIMQQGYAAAQTLIFTTSALSSGQSQWAVVQCAFEQVDVIPADDPNAGLLPYYNAANPTQPLQGPGGSGATQNTDRTAVASVSIVYGTPSSGTPTVPSASGGNVALYAILLTFGQTQITTIDVCSPTIQSGYPTAPFYPGLTGRSPLYSSGSHHHGAGGDASKIDAGSEISGTAPFTILPVTNTNPPATGGVITQGGEIPVEIIVNTNPNSNAAGAVGDLAIDSGTNVPYWCSTAGTSSTAVWEPLTGGLTPINVTTAPYTATQLQAMYSVSYAGSLAFTMAELLSGVAAQVVIVNNNSYTVTVSPYSGQTINGGSSYAFTGQGATVLFYKDPSSATNWLAYQLVSGASGGLGALQVAGGSNQVGGADAAPIFNSYDSALTFGGASGTRQLPTSGTITGEYWHNGNWTQTGAITSNYARIHITGTMTINNTWTVNTENAGGTTLNYGAGFGAPLDNAYGNGGSFGGAGGIGGLNVNASIGPTYSIHQGLSGSGGSQNMTNTTYGAGGNGGGSLYIDCTRLITITSTGSIVANGAAGQSEPSLGSGGGGGSGGGIWISAWGGLTINTGGNISANGGNGGNGTSGYGHGTNAGGGGGGGYIIIFAPGYINNGTITVSGGTGGLLNGGANGLAGATGIASLNNYITLQRSPA